MALNHLQFRTLGSALVAGTVGVRVDGRTVMPRTQFLSARKGVLRPATSSFSKPLCLMEDDRNRDAVITALRAGRSVGTPGGYPITPFAGASPWLHCRKRDAGKPCHVRRQRPSA